MLDGFVGAVVSGFEFAGRLVSGVGPVVKAAVGEGSAEPFVKEQKEQRDLDPGSWSRTPRLRGGHAVGLAARQNDALVFGGFVQTVPSSLIW